MQTKWTTLVPLLVLVVLTWFAGQWMRSAPGSSIATVPALSYDEEDAVARLERDVKEICSVGERRPHVSYNIKRAGEWVSDQLRREGYDVVLQSFDSQGKNCVNLTAELPGTSNAKEVVVLGAHLDSPRKSGGADDNASGCAVLLEIARVMRDDHPDRSVRFAFFGVTEPPVMGKADMGSRVWLDAALGEGAEIVAMLSLDSLGYFDPKPGAQSFPLPLQLFYPSRGDWVGFESNLGSRDLLAECVGTFRDTGRMPAEAMTLPGWALGVGKSDHATFWSAGIPALRVTDTHGWRNPVAGTGGDHPSMLDYGCMARTVTGLVAVTRRLAGRASL